MSEERPENNSKAGGSKPLALSLQESEENLDAPKHRDLTQSTAAPHLTKGYMSMKLSTPRKLPTPEKRSSLHLRTVPVPAVAALAALAATSACTFTARPKAGVNEAARSAQTVSKFESFRTDGKRGFEGIYVRIFCSPTKVVDVLYQDLCKLEDKLTSLCKGSAIDGTQWALVPFGPTFGDWIFVPRGDLNDPDEQSIEALVTFLKSKSKELQIATLEGQPAAFAVDTERAEALYDAVWNDPEVFPVNDQMGAGMPTIDTRDNLWALKLTRTVQAHEDYFLSKGKKPGETILENGRVEPVRIAVIDTAMRTDHPEIRGIRSSPALQRSFLAAGGVQEALQTWNGSEKEKSDIEKKLSGWVDRFLGVRNSLTFWGPLMNPNHGTSSVSLVASPPSAHEAELLGDRSGFTVTGTAWGAEILVAKVSNSVVLTGGSECVRRDQVGCRSGRPRHLDVHWRP